MQHLRKRVRRWILIVMLAFFSQAIPDLEEIPMIWNLLTAPAESVEMAEVAENEN